MNRLRALLTVVPALVSAISVLSGRVLGSRVRRVAIVLSMLCLIPALPTSAATFRIEIDYMVAADHSHMPSNTVIEAVQQMFACQGHTLIIEVDDALPHYDVLRRDPENCSLSLFDYSGSPDSFGSIKLAHFDHAFDFDYWHYCIFAHQYEDNTCSTTGSSGLGQISGRYFIVTLGGFDGQTGTPYEQAATLAHEFGHNLGLTHCGSMQCSDSSEPAFVDDYTPNLPSIMSYRYQLAGVRNQMLCLGLTVHEAPFKNLDYSHGRMCPLEESSLSESFGSGMASTDWDCDGSVGGIVAQDISGEGAGVAWCGSSGTLTELVDFDEWAYVADVAKTYPKETDHPVREVSCITAKEWEMVKMKMQVQQICTDPTLEIEPCLTARNIYIGPGALPFGICISPFPGIQYAHTVAPSGSVFYITPGTYDEPGTTLLTKPGYYFCHYGTAVIK
jgi:hypothetical protein